MLSEHRVWGAQTPVERTVTGARLALAGVAVILLPLAAGAETLRLGGPLLDEVAIATPGALDGDLPGRFESSRDVGGLALEFTPRSAMAFLFGEQSGLSEDPAELRLTLARDPAAFSRWEILDGSSGAAGDGALEIGGALRWADWSLGSAYARTSLFGGEADLFSATLGYGPVSARLAYGQAEGTAASGDLDVLMLSTDLAAASWLTLETDLAMGAPDDRSRETLAVGRFGIRLNF